MQEIKVYGAGTGGSSQSCLVSGQVVGQTLVLNCATGTVNVPLTGVEAAVNFNALTPIQVQALKDSLRGDAVLDSFDSYLGHFI